ncbi:acetate/propionate family kinase [Paraburkholderia caballeronis]|uniref:Acetate kinase n=1 Tax=Paraburkholderia caballeronis TaxID=416943 RepID=A0A1H7TS63_9BURK|nr:acetate/propionate family kinase [Paraburkholderia caballeronis]PXW17620.1 acetate kinase [Paraburkholderia caballeronis]PXW95365.1 acetate kinase [Paraburkholderia caballeronis]RAJ91179.1 acetate kinase [Paraburkholderia caballeronis]SEE14074.1 acetate kinase [Paraburkholderia caballeronis]SEL87438.1 acetate kinase [Paraburkholderia caballeronis]
MLDPLLILNAGSSSVKFSVYETRADRTLAAGVHGQVERIDTTPHLRVSDADGRVLADGPVEQRGHDGAIRAIHDWFAAHVGSEDGFDGVGHRIVHGGSRYTEPIEIDADVLAGIEALVPLAPLHQPHHVAAIRAVAAVAPHVPQIACFDTSFHHTQPAVAQAFALPRELTAKGVHRYGFHGLSYEFIATAFSELAPELAQRNVVVAHLGNGASLCAMQRGRSVATTMGFTALDGLPMGTRAGALDPGVLLYLLQQERMTADEIEHLLYERSGLLGVSGLSADMRTLLDSDAPAARDAVDLFVYRAGRELGSLAAALGGLDALVFTAGIGEHADEIRRRIGAQARWLGVEIDDAANRRHGPRISTDGSRVSVWVIPTDENQMIARHTRRVLDRRPRAQAVRAG